MDYSTFEFYIYYEAILYVPKYTKEKYESTPAWNQFQKIVEMEDNDYASVGTISNGGEAIEKVCYTLGGQRMSVHQRGLSIVRMNDGTIRKMIVK